LRGVQHAHHKAIIHRDLKPSNILVQEIDGRPAPKIIDFGVAKGVTRNLSSDAMLTRVGAMIGTPEYMSPEQASSSGEDIDTRSDVYSLGIVFYELLVGSPPLDLTGATLPDFLRKLREEDPAKPSTRIQKQTRLASDPAHTNRTGQFVLETELRGDLDAIALKALEKERSRRYNSPVDFAADIRRYLNHEAVLAVPPSLPYRARKFARRYRAGLAMTAAFIVVLIVASVISIRQGVRANREAATAEAISSFLQDDVLSQAHAGRQASLGTRPDPDLKVRTALDRAAARIAGKFNGQPEVEASIRHTIGTAYMSLEIFPEARIHFLRSLELYRSTLGIKSEKTLDLMNHVASTMAAQGNYAEAEALLNQSLEYSRRYLGADHDTTVKASYQLGQIRIDTGRFQEAESTTKKVAEAYRRLYGPEDAGTMESSAMLARCYWGQGKLDEAEALLAPLADVARRKYGPDDPETLRILNFLGQLYSDQGKFEPAEAVLKEAIDGQRKTRGPEHPSTLASMIGLANVYADEGRYPEAEALHLQLLDIKRRRLGAENRQTLNSVSYLVSLYQRQGKFGDSLPYAEQALAGKRHTTGSDSSVTMDAAADLAFTYVSLGKYSEAEPLARETYDWDRKKRADVWVRFRSESLLGSSLAGQKRFAEAEPMLLEGYQGMVARKGQMTVADRSEIDVIGRWIDEFYRASGKPVQAANWKQNLTVPK
jgi:tetratricopeptide (TPR) repeat protein